MKDLFPPLCPHLQPHRIVGLNERSRTKVLGALFGAY